LGGRASRSIRGRHLRVDPTSQTRRWAAARGSESGGGRPREGQRQLVQTPRSGIIRCCPSLSIDVPGAIRLSHRATEVLYFVAIWVSVFPVRTTCKVRFWSGRRASSGWIRPSQLLGARRIEADVEMVAVAACVLHQPPKTCESQRGSSPMASGACAGRPGYLIDQISCTSVSRSAPGSAPSFAPDRSASREEAPRGWNRSPR